LRAAAGEHKGHGGSIRIRLLRYDLPGIQSFQSIDRIVEIFADERSAVIERMATDLQRVSHVGQVELGLSDGENKNSIKKA